MAKKKTTSKKAPRKRKIKLSDGTVIETTDNLKAMAAQGKTGKNVYNDVTIDEENLPDPNDKLSKLKYPPPKKNPIFRKTWGDFIENVVSRDNFKPSHLHTLEILCDLYVELDALNKFLRTNGMAFKVITVMGESRRLYPEVAQRDKIRAQIQQYSRHLDLFPKKDKSLRGMDEDEDNEWS